MNKGNPLSGGVQMGWRTRIPWRLKLAAKLVLMQVPVPYRSWQRLGLFRHGKMERPDYAYEVFKRHLERVGFLEAHRGFVQLELGPGDSLFSAMIGYSFGASASYLVDVGPFARDDLDPYRSMASFLFRKGLDVPDLSNVTRFDELLAVYRARYGTKGLTSLQELTEDSIDFIWSHSVLQHIRRNEFMDTMRELRRVIRADGVCSHQIDLKDMLDGSLNSLRFRERLWESDFMARSGFYTNRIRYSEMLRLFQQAGFNASVVEVSRWDRLPTPRACLSSEFRCLPDAELCVSGLGVVLRPC